MNLSLFLSHPSLLKLIQQWPTIYVYIYTHTQIYICIYILCLIVEDYFGSALIYPAPYLLLHNRNVKILSNHYFCEVLAGSFCFSGMSKALEWQDVMTKVDKYLSRAEGKGNLFDNSIIFLYLQVFRGLIFPFRETKFSYRFFFFLLSLKEWGRKWDDL